MDRITPAEGRVALVSGGNRGLGLEVVRMLAEREMRVVLGCRSVESGRVALELLGDLAGRVAVRQLDITDPDSVTRLMFWLTRCLGRCDVLVNNAAVHLDDERDSTAVDLNLARRTLDTNLLGTWRITQAVVPLMRARSYGRIVNVSGCSLPGEPRSPAYRVSKGAVNVLTRTLADELAGDGIVVNACCPLSSCLGLSNGLNPHVRPISADTPVWLATMPDGGPTGGYYCARTATADR